MKLPKSLSYSAISTFEECPWKFMRIYDGGEEGKRAPRAYAYATMEGSIVHEVLDLWHKHRVENETLPPDKHKEIDWKRLMIFVMENSKNPYTGEKNFTYSTDSHQFLGAYALLSDYFKRDDIYANTIHTELPFNYRLPNGVNIGGRIDRIDDVDEQRPGTHIRFVDYKTTRTYVYKSDVENSLQGSMYTLVGKYHLYPKATKIEFVLDALRFAPIIVEFDPGKLQAAELYIESVARRIEGMTPAEAKPVLNKYCAYCQFQDECPAIKAVREGKQEPKDKEGRDLEIDGHDIGKLAEGFLLYGGLENTYKKLKSAHETRLTEFLDRQGVMEYKTGDLTVAQVSTRYGNPKLEVKRANGGIQEESE